MSEVLHVYGPLVKKVLNIEFSKVMNVDVKTPINVSLECVALKYH